MSEEKATCQRCKRVVYAMEAVSIEGISYHKTCFKCAQCNRTLAVNNYGSYQGEIYCTTHKPKEVGSSTIPLMSKGKNASSDALSKSRSGSNILIPSRPPIPIPPSLVTRKEPQYPEDIKKQSSEEIKSPESVFRYEDIASVTSIMPPEMNASSTTTIAPPDLTLNQSRGPMSRIRRAFSKSRSDAPDPSTLVSQKKPSESSIELNKPGRTSNEMISKESSIQSSKPERVSNETIKGDVRGEIPHSITITAIMSTAVGPSSAPLLNDQETYDAPLSALPATVERSFTNKAKNRLSGLFKSKVVSSVPKVVGPQSAIVLGQSECEEQQAIAAVSNLTPQQKRQSMGLRIARALSFVGPDLSEKPAEIQTQETSRQRKRSSTHAADSTPISPSRPEAPPATGSRHRPQISTDTKENFLGKWGAAGSRTNLFGSRVAETASQFEAKSRQESDKSNGPPNLPLPKPPASEKQNKSPRYVGASPIPGSLISQNSGFSPPSSFSEFSSSVFSASMPVLLSGESLQTKVDQLTEIQQTLKQCTKELFLNLEIYKSAKDKKKISSVDFISHFRNLRNNLRKFIELTNSIVTVVELRRAGIELIRFEKEMGNDMGLWTSNDEFKQVLASIHTNVEFVMRRYTLNEKRLLIKSCEGYKEEGGVDLAESRSRMNKVPYSRYILEHLPDAHYFRRHFMGQEHSTFIGFLEKQGPVIISLKREDPDVVAEELKPKVVVKNVKTVEVIKKPLDDAEKSNSWRGDQDRAFRAIVRIKDQPEKREIVMPAQLKKNILGKISTKAILNILNKDFISAKLKLIEDKTVEQRLLALDELKYVTRYKFGVVLCVAGQTVDNDFFGNTVGSQGYDRFLELLGDKVELKGFKNYSGGLDITNGRTGTHSIYSKWRDFEVMFHVSTLLPHNPTDTQQIERKRHVGNDVINIIYLDGDVQFDPASIRTQFTHIFFVVKEEPAFDDNSKPGFRICLSSNNDVPKFGPQLPDPNVFYDRQELHDFILAKLINGENAAYRAPKFSKPTTRTYNALVDDIADTFYKGAGSRKATMRASGPTSPNKPREDSSTSNSQSPVQALTARVHEALGHAFQPSAGKSKESLEQVNSTTTSPSRLGFNFAAKTKSMSSLHSDMKPLESNAKNSPTTGSHNLNLIPMIMPSTEEEDWNELFDLGKETDSEKLSPVGNIVLSNPPVSPRPNYSPSPFAPVSTRSQASFEPRSVDISNAPTLVEKGPLDEPSTSFMISVLAASDFHA